MTHPTRLKRLMTAGKPAIAVWLGLPSPAVAEIVSVAGYDAAIIDQEHGTMGLETAIDMMRGLRSGGDTTAMIRVPSHDPDYLKRVLDAGAEAVMVPMVNTAEEAAAIVSACRYPPLGRRGYAVPAIRASAFGTDARYQATAHERLVIAVQIETKEAVANAAEIAAVAGVDMVFVGAGDLSGSLGHLADTGHPEVEAAIAEVVAAVQPTGKALGTIPRPGKSVIDLASEGWGFVAGAVDTMMLRAASVADVSAFRAAHGDE